MRSEKRRLSALAAAITPKGSFAARFGALTDTERSAYHAWRRHNDRWHLRHESAPGDAYAAILDGAIPPALPATIREKLFGQTPTIIATMTVDQAAEAYRRMQSGD